MKRHLKFVRERIFEYDIEEMEFDEIDQLIKKFSIEALFDSRMFINGMDAGYSWKYIEDYGWGAG